MARLFISYARADGREFSDVLTRDLNARGHSSWLDRARLTGGMNWTDEIEAAIDGSEAVLAVLTDAYRGSRVASMELYQAFRREKPLIPLLVSRTAEVPFLLGATQYEDFTNSGQYEASLLALLRTIETLPAARAERLRRGVAASDLHPGYEFSERDWENVAAVSRRQTGRFIQEYEGTPERPGAFVPELYVRRQPVEDALEAFLDGTRTALLLSGDSGTGKTNLLCHWALDLLNRGHVVLAYDCGSLVDDDIEREIAKDVGPAGIRDLLPALEKLGNRALVEDRKVVFIFDSVNDYQGAEQRGPLILLKRINGLVSRLSETAVRFVVSCNAPWWERQERFGPMRLDWRRYFSSNDGDPLVRLQVFTPAEFETAYPRYQKFFTLRTPLEDLPPALRERLREPVLLRMIAEAHRRLTQPLTTVALAVGIYRRFFEERVRSTRDQLFVEDFASEMLQRKSAVLSVSDLARHERLGPEILNEDASSTYCRLLDRGVLRESHADVRAGATIQFAYARLGAYALARLLMKRSPDDARTAATLVEQSSSFPLAWDTAKTLLVVSKAEEAIVRLAEGHDPEQREVAAEALVELSADEPAAALSLLSRLLDRKSDKARRTALKAAYKMGPIARSLFVRAALDADTALRGSVRDVLYLIWRAESAGARRKTVDTLYLMWRHAPGFTYEFLNDLAAQIRLTNPAKAWTILEFVADLSITIYINHCEQPEVIDHTIRLYHDLATRRFRLNLINPGLLGTRFEKLLFRSVARVFSRPILTWMLFGDTAEAKAFFDLPAGRRACLARIAPALDPSTDVTAVRDDLVQMLGSGTTVFAGAAALVIAVHSCRNFAATAPLVRQMFDELQPDGRLWLLLSFCVLLPDTPQSWIPLLENGTSTYIAGDLQSFRRPPTGLLSNFDIALLPLGLAYGKAGESMPLFEKLIQEASGSGDTALLARIVSALGPVGFYFPHPTFHLFRAAFAGADDGAVQKAMVSALATIKTLHFDAVDHFLDELNAPEQLRREIDAAADVERVHRYIHVVGYYNNAVHYTLNYPRMRRRLAAGALKLLAEARDAEEFVAAYTTEALHMFREAKFHLREWTLPE